MSERYTVEGDEIKPHIFDTKEEAFIGIRLAVSRMNKLHARLAELEPEWIPGVPSEPGFYWIAMDDGSTRLMNFTPNWTTVPDLNMMAYYPIAEPVPCQPPKSIEQLQAERNAAADELWLAMGEAGIDYSQFQDIIRKYENARQAHIDSEDD